MFEDHFYLSGKNKGITKSLTGNVCVLTFFVNEKGTQDKLIVEKYYAALLQACEVIEQEAKRNGKQLTFSRYHYEVSMHIPDDVLDCHNRIVREALKMFLFDSADHLIRFIKEKYHADEVTLFFFINREMRSFSLNVHGSYCIDNTEYAFIFRNDTDKKSIIHELLHSFGARDLYFPPEVKKYADLFLPDSIMSYGEKFDGLTKYLIGWSDKIDLNTIRFLENTKGVSENGIIAYLNSIWEKEKRK